MVGDGATVRQPDPHAGDSVVIHDPVTLEVIRNKLDGIANEMQVTLIRSSSRRW
jgi:hypothetical protein